MNLPQCARYDNAGNRCRGTLLPLSDYGRDASSMSFKAWLCSNEECGFAVAIDNGQPGYVKKVGDRRPKERK